MGSGRHLPKDQSHGQAIMMRAARLSQRTGPAQVNRWLGLGKGCGRPGVNAGSEPKPVLVQMYALGSCRGACSLLPPSVPAPGAG